MISRLRNFGLADTVELQMRVQGWAEARFVPGDSDVVMVNEIVCGQPGCPPLETVIAGMPTDGITAPMPESDVVTAAGAATAGWLTSRPCGLAGCELVEARSVAG